LAGGLAAGILIVASARSQDIHVEGTIAYTAFNTTGATLVAISRKFILDASGDKWLVHTVGLAGPNAPRQRWHEAAGDGTNVYTLHIIDPPTNLPATRAAHIRRAGVKKPILISHGKVEIQFDDAQFRRDFPEEMMHRQFCSYGAEGEAGCPAGCRE
jgi:hypothetical protein